MMKDIQKTEHYKKFSENPIVKTVHNIASKMPRVRQEEESSWTGPDWIGNLLRWQMRFQIAPICFWYGYMDLINLSEV